MTHRGVRRATRLGSWRVVMLIALALSLISTAPVAAQPSTPATPGVTPLQELSSLLPDTIPDVDDSAIPTIYYADIAAQLDAVGTTPPSSFDDPAMADWIAATRSLTVAPIAAQYLQSWRNDYGFDLLQADQTLSFSAPPMDLTIYRGRFDTSHIEQTLEAIGYQRVEVGGYELLSIRADFEIGMDAPTAYKMAAMNFGVVLDDRTIAFSSAGAPLAAVLDVTDGLAPSAMDSAGFAMVVDAAPADLVSAVLVPGPMLAGGDPASVLDIGGEGTPDVGAIATEMAQVSEMPPVLLALVGSTAGGPLPTNPAETPAPDAASPDIPDARAIAIALMPSPELAQAAIPVVEERLETGVSTVSARPYAVLFAGHDVRAADGQPILLIDLTLGDETFPHILVDMVFQRDLGFLAW